MRGDWVDLAAFLMMLAGSVDALQGLIAIIRNHYYTLDPNEIIVVDLTTWGWILLVWGLVVALSGAAIWLRSEAARWFAVVVLLFNLVGELAFAGGHSYTLWALTANLLTIIVLYALIVRWDGAEELKPTSKE
jgi:hypothetical protein